MMPDSILKTKFYKPAFQTKLVPRPRLILGLNRSLSQKLSLISAPAGCGKTTLACDWLSQIETPSTWLSLEEADNDPVRFWSYLITALQAINPELGTTTSSLLYAPQSPPIENLLTLLINEISNLAEQIILVLDDYHVISTATIHKGLNFLLAHQPSQLHLVIITREDPPFPLARLRVRQDIVEIREKDLRFTVEETAHFLNHTMGLSLGIAEISAMEHRTEGWAAGLQLAALSIHNMANPTEFIETFTGNDRHVVDYLASEVIERQSTHIQQFLLQTALLTRLSVPLCNAVTQQKDARKILTYLEDANLFLISLDNRREWYRYHRLFGDLLRYHLKGEVGIEGIKQLHQRAAVWYQENEFTDEAIHHFLESEDFIQAASLIETIGIHLIMQGQLGKLLNWLDRLPEKIIRTRPLLSACHAWALNITGQPAAIEARLKDAEQSLSTAPSTQRQDIQGVIHTVRSYLLRRQGDMKGSVGCLQQALTDLSPDNFIVRSSVNLNLGFNHLIVGQLTQAEQRLEAAKVEGRVSQAVYVSLIAMAVQGNTYIEQGKLRQARQLFEATIKTGLTENKGQPFPPAGYAYAGLGLVLYEQNELDAAEQHLNQAVQLGEWLADWSIIRRGLLPLAWLKQMQGDHSAAQSLWQKALTVVQQAESKRVETQLMTHQVRLWLAQVTVSPTDESLLTEAIKWAQVYRQGQPDSSSYQEIPAQLTLAWVDLLQGQSDQAFNHLKALAEVTATHGWQDFLIKTLALQALVQSTQNDWKMALNTLNRALELASPEGYIRTFVDYGLPMQQLLKQAAQQRTHLDYVSKLLASFPHLKDDTQSEHLNAIEHPVGESQTPLLEPLNYRELSILRLMAEGFSNREIAEELSLSVNTIKWYISHLYGKLSVRKRAEAVDRAHELGIL